ncbi:MAG: tRNA (adenosine(37)-N6)-threonylcarbamoyltransferase complex transferase subunit TsaD [Bacteroidota bacterium]
MAIILGIESSCDETSASICIDSKIINNEIVGQNIHVKYGGVVPELASREHHKNIVPVVDTVLNDAQVPLDHIDAIAYTRGPGLLGALLIGSSFAKSMAAALDIPIIPVHHMKAHVLAHFIDDPKPPFPFLCLTISGGHTQILKVSSVTQMEILGQTQDDAVGEAFDKTAKLLGLSYPGGPLIDQLSKKGDPNAFKFAETEMPNLDYSFSGIKTSILYFLKKKLRENKNFISENLEDLAASIQHTLIKMLLNKLQKAANIEKTNHIAISGGVSANSGLRLELLEQAKVNGWEVYIPDIQYCTDNAGMIAISGHLLYENSNFGSLYDSPLPRMPL